jgi:broad specificity phosphatase PhoE
VKDIYIFRHGETDGNKARLWLGSGIDMPLNETGRAQARELAEKMKDIRLDAVFSSPLIRAFETAKIIADGRKIPVIKDSRLSEISCGILEGRPQSESSPEIVERYYADDLNFQFPGGDMTKLDCVNRFLSFAKGLEGTDYNSVGAATHGGVIGGLFRYLGKPLNKSVPQGVFFHYRLIDGKLISAEQF